MKNPMWKNIWLFVCPYFTILFASSLLFVSQLEMKLQREIIDGSTQMAEKTRDQFAHNELNKEAIDVRLNGWQETNETISKTLKTISDQVRIFLIALIAFNLFGILVIWYRLRKVEINVKTSK
jgi:ABC-type lipoprotein release transport system permease subunit